MTIELAPEHEVLVNELVSTGRYGSVEQVVHDSMENLGRREQNRRKHELLRAMILEGLAEAERGETVNESVDEMLADILAKQ